MVNKISKSISFLILLGFLILPCLVFAATTTAPLIQTLTTAAVNTTLYIASAVTIILWILTGILFLTAQGAPEKLIKARTALISAVAGTLLVIVANSAIYLVGQAFGIV